MDEQDRLLTTAEYAHLLGISIEHLYRLERRRQLPIQPVRIGQRIKRWSLNAHRDAVRAASLLQVGATIQHEEDN